MNITVNHNVITFIEAICHSDTATMQQLRPDIDIDATNAEGYSALQHAIWLGKIDMVRWLLNEGAAPGAPNRQGNTPLHIATWCSYRNYQLTAETVYPICELLLEFNSSPNVTNGFGLTPLHHAVYYEFSDVVRLMISHGGDPSYSISPINRAHSELDSKFWSQFDEAGFKPGMTAYEIAELKKNLSLLNILSENER